MSNAFDRVLANPVPQREPVSPEQVKNSAGGYTFTVSDRSRLERFLILGTDGGTFYAKEKDYTKENISFVVEYIKRDELSVNEILRAVSTEGRAYKQSPAIFTAALLLVHGQQKPLARETMKLVCRTSTQLFEFVRYIELLGGWGRSKKQAVAEWYTQKEVKDLAYQVVKYRQRDGWTHRDLFRLSHPVNVDPTVGRFLLGKTGEIVGESSDYDILRAFLAVQEQTTIAGVLGVLDQGYARNLPWESIPTQFHKEPELWKKLFDNGQLNGQALVRNITRLSRIGAFNDMVFARAYADKLTNEEMIRRTRLHPMNFLNSIVVHQNGQIARKGQVATSYDAWSGGRVKDWETVPVILDALNAGFHTSFKTIVPANKRTMLALDVSGSMASLASGLDLTCAQVNAAMSMTVAKTEPYHMIRGFCHTFKDLGISGTMDLNSVMHKVQDNTFGSTDCSLPMAWAFKNNVEIDTFQVWTDNETYAGRMHPHKALEQYRQATGINAKLAVVAITATDFTIADPSDSGMMDFVGVDSNTPRVMADFSGGRL